MNRPADIQAGASGNEPAGALDPGFIVIDASIWVPRLVPNHIFHGVVKAWMEQQRAKETVFLSPSLLLPEVGGAIARRTGEPHLAREAIDSLVHLAGLQLVQMDQAMVQEAARLASDLGLRGADSIYVAVCYRLKLPLATLDEDQKTRAASRIDMHFPQK